MRQTAAFILLLFSVSNHAQTSVSEAEKIATFFKVWGFLKYYHPEVAKGKSDWDQEFISKIQTISNLQTKQQTDDFYINWISSLGIINPCKTCKNETSGEFKSNLDFSWLNDSTAFSTTLIGKLQYIRDNRNQGKNYYVQQDQSDGKTTYENEKIYKDSIFPSQQLRLLGLSRYWNIVNYFYPYKYNNERNWNAILLEMIPKFQNSKDIISYHLAMRELVVSINDSHASFATAYTDQYFGLKMAPFQFKIIDNKSVVTSFYNDSLSRNDDIRIGDVFLSLENKTIEALIEEKEKYISASNKSVKLRNLAKMIFNGQSDVVNATFERNGTISRKAIHRYLYEDLKIQAQNPHAKAFKVLSENIGYVDLGILQEANVDQTLDQLKDTKAIIFDIRNYPNWTLFRISNFLNQESKPFVRATKANLSHPGIFNTEKPLSCGKRNKKPYKGKVILLVDETTQSRAEFTVMALQTAENATIIGSQTAGADGTPSLITFPGNYKTFMTGTGIYYPDGKETQRIGIIPDIEVKPTIAGIKSGKDEVLEKAIEWINGK